MKTTRQRRDYPRWTYAMLFALAALLLVTAAVWLVPLPSDLGRPLAATPTLVEVKGRVLATIPSSKMRVCEPRSIGEMGRWLPQVTVALEDHRFRNHPGDDLHALASAVWRNLRAGRVVSGGSTITQQLVKLASHDGTHRSCRIKVYENFAALKLEQYWSKDRILEAYLNRSNYGNRRIGPAAAAIAYFRKDPEYLTLPEAIYLAGLPQAPSRFNPWRHPKAADAKYRRSLARLVQLGFLRTDEATRMQKPPAIAPPHAPPRLAPHFVDALLQQHRDLPSGVVQTTLDLDLQQLAQAQLRAHLAHLAHWGVRDGAVVIIDVRDGAIRAMVGSTDYSQPRGGQINGAAIFRSAGSTLKPFLYTIAFQERLLTAATLLPDTPDAVRAEYIDYDPMNYDKHFWGPVRVREALANSLNVPAVIALSRVGARRTYLALEECGLRFARPFSEYGAGLILGNAEVCLLDLTAAYTLFAGNKLAVEPRFLEAAPVRHRAFAAPTASSIVADILADNDARKKTFSAFSPLVFEGYRIPCKTGTSSGFRDGWTVGVTAQHAVGVWVGNFDGRPMHEVAAIAGAAPIFHAIVQSLLDRGDTSVPPPTGSDLSAAPVCRLTGLRPNAASPGTIEEWFLAGTEPAEDAGRYLRIIDGQARLSLPAEYAAWCRGPLNYLNAAVENSTQLRVISPVPNSTFLIDAHLSRSQQALRLLAVGAENDDQIWKIDGEHIIASKQGFFWPLRKGAHIVEVASGARHAAAEFKVQ